MVLTTPSLSLLPLYRYKWQMVLMWSQFNYKLKLGHMIFTRPRASPPIDGWLGHPLLHMQLEPWVSPCVFFDWWFSLRELWGYWLAHVPPSRLCIKESSPSFQENSPFLDSLHSGVPLPLPQQQIYLNWIGEEIRGRGWAHVFGESKWENSDLLR